MKHFNREQSVAAAAFIPHFTNVVPDTAAGAVCMKMASIATASRV